MKKEIRENTVTEFIRLFNAGIEAWVEAGKVLVTMLEHNPNVKEKILKEFPGMTSGILGKLEAIGRGSMAPELVMSDAPQFKFARELPMSDQKKLVKEPVSIVIEKDGEFDQIEVDFKNLSASQSVQVFAKDHIRTPQEQRLFIEDKKAKSKRPTKDWEIEGGMVVFNRRTRLTVGELSRIMGILATGGVS